MLVTNHKPRPEWFKPFANPSICYNNIPLWADPEESQARASWLFRARLTSSPIASATTKSRSFAFFTVHASGLRSFDGKHAFRLLLD